MKLKIKIGSFFLSLSLFSSQVSARDISIDEAISIGLQKSENIQQAIFDIEIAKEQVEEAWASVYPQISAQVQTIRHTKAPVLQFNGTSVPVKQDWELLSSLQITQVIYSFGRVKSALEMAKISSDMQNTAKKVLERELRYAVEMAYYNVQLSKNILKISKDSIGNARKNQKALEKRFQGGRVPRLDNLRMQSDIASRVPSLSNAQKNLELAYLQFNLLLELDRSERPNLTSKLDLNYRGFDDALLRAEIQNTPQIKLSKLKVDMADKQVGHEKSNHYPSISAFGNISHNGTGAEMPPENENLFTSTSIGIMVNIPIYEGGAVNARTRQKVFAKARAEIDRKRQTEELELSLNQSLVEYRTNLDRLNAAKDAVRLAKQAYDLTRTRFETGGATRNDLNDSERSLTSARIQVESIKYEIFQNKANINKLTKKVVSND